MKKTKKLENKFWGGHPSKHSPGPSVLNLHHWQKRSSATKLAQHYIDVVLSLCYSCTIQQLCNQCINLVSTSFLREQRRYKQFVIFIHILQDRLLVNSLIFIFILNLLKLGTCHLKCFLFCVTFFINLYILPYHPPSTCLPQLDDSNHENNHVGLYVFIHK